MIRPTQPVQLTNNEIRSLTSLLTRGTTPARTTTRARILDLLHRGERPSAIATTLQVTPQTVFNIKRRYLTEGLASALHDHPRCGRPIQIDGKQRAQLTALACSTPPEGRARWTLRLLADKVVELGYCEHLSHTAARQILKKTNSSRI
jgi:transposase